MEQAKTPPEMVEQANTPPETAEQAKRREEKAKLAALIARKNLENVEDDGEGVSDMEIDDDGQ